jgi:oligogalacturonide lyase
VAWGETEWISHALVHPLDPNTLVFCHEGGNLVDQRLWTVDARSSRKKHARCLYKEKPEESLANEYFDTEGALCVQLAEYDPADAARSDSKAILNSILQLNMDGNVIGKFALPGGQSPHVSSVYTNPNFVADAFLPKPDSDPVEGRKLLSIQYPNPEQTRLRVELLCCHGTSWRTPLSHPNPIFTLSTQYVLFSAEVDGSNSVYYVHRWG